MPNFSKPKKDIFLQNYGSFCKNFVQISSMVHSVPDLIDLCSLFLINMNDTLEIELADPLDSEGFKEFSFSSYRVLDSLIQSAYVRLSMPGEKCWSSDIDSIVGHNEANKITVRFSKAFSSVLQNNDYRILVSQLILIQHYILMDVMLFSAWKRSGVAIPKDMFVIKNLLRFPAEMLAIGEELLGHLCNLENSPPAADRDSPGIVYGFENKNRLVINLEYAEQCSFLEAVRETADGLLRGDSRSIQSASGKLANSRDFFLGNVDFDLPEDDVLSFDQDFNLKSLFRVVDEFEGNLLYDKGNEAIFHLRKHPENLYVFIIFPKYSELYLGGYERSDGRARRNGIYREFRENMDSIASSVRIDVLRDFEGSLQQLMRILRQEEATEWIDDEIRRILFSTEAIAVRRFGPAAVRGALWFGIMSALDIPDATSLSVAEAFVEFVYGNFWKENENDRLSV